MKERGVSLPESLEMLVATEQSRGRFSLGDLENATKLLGFGKDGILDVELDEEVDDDFILGAYKSAVKRAWREPADKVAQLRTDLNEALKIVGEWKCSPKLREVYKQEKGPIMTEEAAYSTLEVPKDVDETMLITIFNVRVRTRCKYLERTLTRSTGARPASPRRQDARGYERHRRDQRQPTASRVPDHWP